MLVATKTHTTNFKVNDLANLCLGARPHKSNTAVKLFGMIDRVRIFDYALSEDQMRLLTFIEGPEGRKGTWPSNNTGISEDDALVFECSK